MWTLAFFWQRSPLSLSIPLTWGPWSCSRLILYSPCLNLKTNHFPHRKFVNLGVTFQHKPNKSKDIGMGYRNQLPRRFWCISELRTWGVGQCFLTTLYLQSSWESEDSDLWGLRQGFCLSNKLPCQLIGRPHALRGRRHYFLKHKKPCTLPRVAKWLGTGERVVVLGHCSA